MRSGVIFKLKEVLGHSLVAITESIYAKVYLSYRSDEMEVLNFRLSDGTFLALENSI